MERCWDWKGSRWWKVDFHAHTPASGDYCDKEILPREWLLSFMKAEIDESLSLIIIRQNGSKSYRTN